MSCKANRRAEWIIRLRAEMSRSDFGLFVTLTNDDEHLNFVDVVNEQTGEVFKKQAPDKRTIQLFLKRLRKVIGNEHMRYFIISEYGDRTARSHYHGLFFFRDIPKDRKLYDAFTQAWKNGFLKFGDITPASITYCTKYVLKLSTLPLGINDNFVLCSRRPAIGYDAIMEQIDVENHAVGNISQISLHGVSGRLPRLYRDKLLKRYEQEEVDVQEYKDSLAAQSLKERAKKFAKFKREHPECNGYDFLRFEAYNNDLLEQQLQYNVKQQNLF